ncbi:MAG: hypothetical protein R3C56_07505 [Pirellulaceae bacterium]
MTLATPGVDPPAALGHAAGQSLATPSASSRWMMVALQLLLAVLIVRMFEIEEPPAVVHHVGHRHRWISHIFPIALPVAIVVLRFPDWPDFGTDSRLRKTALAFAVGSSLVGLCYLPLAYWWRIGLLLAAGVLLAILRSGSSSLFWPVVGSMFMFRLILFVSDTRSQPKMPPLQESLPLFLPDSQRLLCAISCRRFLHIPANAPGKTIH